MEPMTVAAEVVSMTDITSILTSLTGQISVANIVGVLAALVGASVGFAFMWWGGRKLIRVVMGAFKKGKISI